MNEEEKIELIKKWNKLDFLTQICLIIIANEIIKLLNSTNNITKK